MQDTIRKNLLQIQDEIAPYISNIIAVTKYFDENAIIAAYNAGIRNFGESRAVEAVQKIINLPIDIRENSKFHFIGHLQTNKVHKVVGVFEFIHSVDSVKLAKTISDEALKIGIKQKILLQLNNAGEEQKFGFSKEEIFKAFAEINKFDGVEIAGLMNMAPLGANETELERLFTEVVETRNRINKEFNCDLKEISMGMSQDYKIAARMGSTMLRIGRKLFN